MMIINNRTRNLTRDSYGSLLEHEALMISLSGQSVQLYVIVIHREAALRALRHGQQLALVLLGFNVYPELLQAQHGHITRPALVHLLPERMTIFRRI